ncbi:MAG: MFS transporter [Bdellovibrionales bacterium]|nr:MFS transporter [Bdellovibrionales bacterium]
MLKHAISINYFFAFSVYGIAIPFLSIILHDKGLNDAQVNLVMGANGLAVILAPMFVSYFADRHLSVRRLQCLLALGVSAVVPFLHIVHSTSSGFFVTLAFFSLMVPNLSNLDAFTVHYAKQAVPQGAKQRGFQNYRLWGSIGFTVPGLCLLPLSWWMDISADLLIQIATLAAFLSVCSALGLPDDKPAEAQNRSLPSTDAIRLALKPPLFGLFASTIVAGLALSQFYIAYPRYLQELSYSNTAISLIINLGVFWEILLMPFTQKLIARFGARKLVMLAILSIPLRLFLVVVWPTPTMIIATQILHAPLVIGLFITIPIFLGEIAGPSFKFSMQSLNTTLVFGVSRLLGPLIAAGLLQLTALEGFGAQRALLILSSCLGLLAFVVLILSAEGKVENHSHYKGIV